MCGLIAASYRTVSSPSSLSSLSLSDCSENTDAGPSDALSYSAVNRTHPSLSHRVVMTDLGIAPVLASHAWDVPGLCDSWLKLRQIDDTGCPRVDDDWRYVWSRPYHPVQIKCMDLHCCFCCHHPCLHHRIRSLFSILVSVVIFFH